MCACMHAWMYVCVYERRDVKLVVALGKESIVMLEPQTPGITCLATPKRLGTLA